MNLIFKKILNEWFLNSLKDQNKIELFNDIQFNPVSMNTLYQCIEHILCNFKSGLYNFGSRKGLTKAEFCLKIMKKLNINYKKINIVSVEQSDLFAYRPKGMMMNTYKFENNFKFKIPDIVEEIDLIYNSG